jgi:hypothetical protein
MYQYGNFLSTASVLVIAKDTTVDFAVRGDNPYHENYKIVVETPL